MISLEARLSCGQKDWERSCGKCGGSSVIPSSWETEALELGELRVRLAQEAA
jgi:hypothetical protein